MKRLNRLTLHFPKSLRTLKLLSVFISRPTDFVKRHNSLRMMPAMARSLEGFLDVL